MVKERTREIGVKRALGAKRKYVKHQVILEAVWIALLGGSIGGIVALVMVELLQAIPVSEGLLELLGKPTFSMPIFLATVSILGVVGFASGYFPARRATRVDPVEAL